MKIFVLPVPNSVQSENLVMYPPHHNDFGVEQDFLKYLDSGNILIANDPDEADWHYLPIFWTRWHVAHNYAATGIKELQRIVDKVVIDESKTFTICQYDDGILVKAPKMKIFVSSRNTKGGVDIPLLSTPHKLPMIKPLKQYLGSFIGRINNHPIRGEMANAIGSESQFLIINGNLGVNKYVRTMLKSLVALCPRGYGGNSFRFYEAMQLGVVPFLIGDIDTRPFKGTIAWDQCSMYTPYPSEIQKIIKKHSNIELRIMGRKAREIYYNELTFGKWCHHLLEEL